MLAKIKVLKAASGEFYIQVQAVGGRSVKKVRIPGVDAFMLTSFYGIELFEEVSCGTIGAFRQTLGEGPLQSDRT